MIARAVQQASPPDEPFDVDDNDDQYGFDEFDDVEPQSFLTDVDGVPEEIREAMRTEFGQTWIPFREELLNPPDLNSRAEREAVAEFIRRVFPAFQKYAAFIVNPDTGVLHKRYLLLTDAAYEKADELRQFAIKQIKQAIDVFFGMYNDGTAWKNIQNPNFLFALIRLQLSLFAALDMADDPNVKRLKLWARAAVDAAHELRDIVSPPDDVEEAFDDGIPSTFSVPAEEFDSMTKTARRKTHIPLPSVVRLLRNK